jgi:hypothetical protein
MRRPKPVILDAPQLDRLGGLLLHLAKSRHHKTTVERIAGELLDNFRWSDVLSERDLVKRLRDSVIGLRCGADPTLPDARGVMVELAQEVETWDDVQVVYLPITGVALPDGDVVIGEWRLRTVDEAAIAEVTQALREVLSRTSYAADEQNTFVESTRDFIDRWLAMRDPVLLQLDIVSTPPRAVELASERRHELIDLLRARSLAMFSRKSRAAIGVPGDFASDLDDVWALSRTSGIFASSTAFRGPIQPFLLSRDVAEEFFDGPFGFYPLIEEYPEERSEMEDLLLTALHWIADSAVQAKPENQLLSLFIALETILTGRSGITRDLSEGMAFLLADELEERRAVRDTVRALYEGRGHVAHGGARDVADRDVGWLTDACLGVLQRILQRRVEFPTRRILSEWLDSQRLK